MSTGRRHCDHRDGMPPSVLVVDDDPVFRDLARRLLAAEGLEDLRRFGADAFVAKHELPDAPLVRLLGRV
jgi:CheY-like chemotaxis protein